MLYYISFFKKEINYTIKDKKGCHDPKLKIKKLIKIKIILKN